MASRRSVALISAFVTCAATAADSHASPVTILIESAPYEIDPRVAGATHGLKIGQLIFCGLTRVSERLTIVPDLAERWSIADGGRTYTFFLRRGLHFHDGVPVTARDVKFTFDTLLDERFGSRYHGVYRDKIRAVEIVDDLTVRFHLHRPQAPFLADMTTGIVPAHLAGASRDARIAFETRLVGTGPYRLVAREGDDRVALARFDGHHAAALSRITFRVVRNEVTRYLELVKGDADIVQNALSPLYIPLIANNKDLRVEAAPSIILTYMVLNFRDPHLADIRVRRAIAHGIDRRAIVAAKMRGLAVVARGFLATVHPVHSPDLAEIAFDPARARALLKEAGYGPGATPLRLTYKTSTDRFRLSIARVIASQLRRVGIEVDVRPYEFGTFFADLRKGAFQMATLQWPEFDEPDALHSLFHSTRVPTPDNPHIPRGIAVYVATSALARVVLPGALLALPLAPSLLGAIDQPGDGPNRGRFISPRADALLVAAQQEIDVPRRRALYAAVERLLIGDLPMFPLWHEHNIAVVRSRIQNVRPQPNGKWFSLTRAWATP